MSRCSSSFTLQRVLNVHHQYKHHPYNRSPCIKILLLFGLNVFILDDQQPFRLPVVLQQIYMKNIYTILQNMHTVFIHGA